MQRSTRVWPLGLGILPTLHFALVSLFLASVPTPYNPLLGASDVSPPR